MVVVVGGGGYYYLAVQHPPAHRAARARAVPQLLSVENVVANVHQSGRCVLLGLTRSLGMGSRFDGDAHCACNLGVRAHACMCVCVCVMRVCVCSIVHMIHARISRTQRRQYDLIHPGASVDRTHAHAHTYYACRHTHSYADTHPPIFSHPISTHPAQVHDSTPQSRTLPVYARIHTPRRSGTPAASDAVVVFILTTKNMATRKKRPAHADWKRWLRANSCPSWCAASATLLLLCLSGPPSREKSEL